MIKNYKRKQLSILAIAFFCGSIVGAIVLGGFHGIYYSFLNTNDFFIYQRYI